MNLSGKLEGVKLNTVNRILQTRSVELVVKSVLYRVWDGPGNRPVCTACYHPLDRRTQGCNSRTVTEGTCTSYTPHYTSVKWY